MASNQQALGSPIRRGGVDSQRYRRRARRAYDGYCGLSQTGPPTTLSIGTSWTYGERGSRFQSADKCAPQMSKNPEVAPCKQFQWGVNSPLRRRLTSGEPGGWPPRVST